jgi:Tol biopolymer transport system component
MPVQDSVQYKRLTFEAGTIYTARFAPDGQSIVYGAAWNGKPVQLFMTVGGSLLPQALQFSDANLLAISRDNELALVLHGMHTAQLETVNGTLARAPLAGTSPHEVLSDVRWADWDAEGKLAAVHSVEGVSRLEYPLGTVLNQSSGWISHIRFSPQGDAIAFLNHPALWDNRGTVCVIDLRGQVQTLTVEWESESGLAWSPNGKEIWFTASDKGTNLSLRAVSRNGKLRTLLDLPVAITLQDIAADGRVLVSLNSKRMSLAYTTLGGSLDSDLSWHDWNPARDISSDGSFVLFEDSSEAAGPNYAVVIRKTDGSPPETLGEGSPAALSPDGKWVLSTFNSKAAEISVLPVGAGQARSIPVSGLDHVHNGWGRYLPDGQRVVVNGDIGGQSASCYVIDLASGKARSVTPVGTICGPVSPDGRFLIGVVTGKSITIYPIDGGKARSLPRPQSNFVAVQWSSDGAFLYGFHPGEFPSRILKFEIATEKETVVQELKPNAPAGVVTVSPVVVSRDGKRFAYSYNQTLSSLFLVSGLR